MKSFQQFINEGIASRHGGFNVWKKQLANHHGGEHGEPDYDDGKVRNQRNSNKTRVTLATSKKTGKVLGAFNHETEWGHINEHVINESVPMFLDFARSSLNSAKEHPEGTFDHHYHMMNYHGHMRSHHEVVDKNPHFAHFYNEEALKHFRAIPVDAK